MKVLYAAAGVFLLLCSCGNRDAKVKEVDPDAIFYDYTVWGQEGAEEVSVLLQYRRGDESGKPMVLESPANVTLDGIPLFVDSAKRTGAFYELSVPADGFAGRHTIVFTDKKGKEHKDQFDYAPLTLSTELPEKIRKEPFVITLNELSAMPATVRLVMTDTAFGTKDVNEEIPLNRGELTITARMWQALKAGPVTLEIFREDEKTLKTGSKEVGRLTTTYHIRREFEAVER